MRLTCVLVSLLLMPLVACHRHYVVREALTAQQIIEWSQQGVAPEEIIRKIDESGTVYILDSRDVVNLTEKGVDSRVIDRMMETQRRDIRRRYDYHRHYYYYYPPPPFAYGWYGPCW